MRTVGLFLSKDFGTVSCSRRGWVVARTVGFGGVGFLSRVVGPTVRREVEVVAPTVALDCVGFSVRLVGRRRVVLPTVGPGGLVSADASLVNWD